MQVVQRYERLAEGDVGTILTIYAYLADYEKPKKRELGIWSDALIPADQRMTSLVHQKGSRIVMQIVHGSSQSQADPGKAKIQDVISLFAAAAGRAKRAGFDGVELHAATAISSPSSSPRSGITGRMPTAGREKTAFGCSLKGTVRSGKRLARTIPSGSSSIPLMRNRAASHKRMRSGWESSWTGRASMRSR